MLSNEELFESLDLELPELADVKAAVVDGKIEEAIKLFGTRDGMRGKVRRQPPPHCAQNQDKHDSQNGHEHDTRPRVPLLHGCSYW